MENRLKPKHANLMDAVRAGAPPVGLYIAFPSPFMVEVAATAGFDYVMLDLEHNVFGMESVCNMIRAADACGIPCTARIAQRELMLPLLDFGIAGFKVPHVRTADQVRELVELCKYAPVGRRGYCTAGRAQRFGAMRFADYLREAAQEVFLMVMIEDREGLDNQEEILAVPGLDFVAVGPGDVSQALGCISETENLRVREAIAQVYATARKHGVLYPGGGAPVIITEDKSALLEILTQKRQAYTQS